MLLFQSRLCFPFQLPVPNNTDATLSVSEHNEDMAQPRGGDCWIQFGFFG